MISLFVTVRVEKLNCSQNIELNLVVMYKLFKLVTVRAENVKKGKKRIMALRADEVAKASSHLKYNLTEHI